ncbi:MAG: hypothetical protein Q8R28_15610, partial [Dehalococcoidia bacterium]|nr:hypothetical protein [Dehalococcoidia bacterium]
TRNQESDVPPAQEIGQQKTYAHDEKNGPPYVQRRKITDQKPDSDQDQENSTDGDAPSRRGGRWGGGDSGAGSA